MSQVVFDFFDKIIYMLSTRLGRDKTCRVIQYFLMMITPKLQAKGAHYNDLVQRLTKLRGSMSQTRKVMRFGLEIPLIKGIRERLIQHEKSPVRMIFWKTISDISLILYFFTDHPMYFNQIGLFKYEKNYIENMDYINNVFWLLNSIFDAAISIVDL